MNSAFFNFDRENIHSYFNKYENDNGFIQKISVPKPQPQLNPITVGNDVWIGRNVTLFGGIKIGDGAVIASGSTVTKDVEPYSLVAGIPAIHKKWRFPEEIRKALIASSWWNYELGDMYREGLDFSDPIKFINQLYVRKQNIRKMDVKKISLSSYYLFGNNYFMLNEQNLLLDHMNKLICIESKAGYLNLVKKDPKNVIGDDLFPVEIKKNASQYFLHIKDRGYIEIENDLSVILHKNSSAVKFTKLSFFEKTFSINIKGMNLSSDKHNNFLLQPHTRAWETFKLSSPLF